MKAGSLFSGIGGPEIALGALGVETIWQSEIDDYASQVLTKRFPGVPNLGDVRQIRRPEKVDILVGGFPCQDISNAGARVGIAGSRSSIWSEYARLIAELQPKLVLIENVSALLNRGLDVVLRDLDALEYACEWDCIPAAAVGAPHLRDRIWMVAYPEDLGPLDVFTDRSELEKSLGNLYHQPSKWPRAGRMEQGAVYVREPAAKRRTKRLNPGSSWVGAELSRQHGWWHQAPLLPTPTATMGDRGGRGDLLQVVRGNASPSGHFATALEERPVFPTPVARDWKGVGLEGQLGTVAARGLWPTPRGSSGDSRSGGGEGGTYVRTPSQQKGTHGLYLQTEAFEASMPGTTAEDRQAVGGLFPDWVEWLMGFPLGWTDLENPTPVHDSWDWEPGGVPRVRADVAKRKQRLSCIGNALVPQVMHWVAKRALERIA